MYCKNCGSELKDGAQFCGICGSKIDEARALNSNAVPKLYFSGKSIGAIFYSIAGIILTTIIRFSVQVKDEIGDFWEYVYVNIVPNNIKPFVLALPIIIALVSIIQVIMDNKTTKNGKAITYVIIAFALGVSIAIVNAQFSA